MISSFLGQAVLILVVLAVGALIGYFAYRRGISKAITDVESAFATATDDAKALVAKVKAKL